MQRFKINDAVFILPKYSHLYCGNSAVVACVWVDQFRPMFNEYTLKFADGSTAELFEFQIIDDIPDYVTVIASAVFDSNHQSAAAQVRGPAPGRQIVLQTAQFDVDMKIQTATSRASILGQVLEKGTHSFLKDADVCLMRDAMTLKAAKPDDLGVFRFADIVRGPLNILVVIPRYMSRILGAFSI